MKSLLIGALFVAAFGAGLALCLKRSFPPAAGQAGIDWVRIPGGSFLMGVNGEEHATPIHRVDIKSFEMSRSPVTFKQYRVCVAAGACRPVDEECAAGALTADDQPVVCVSWNQARKFARWAGGRLPSEAEWEYAARGAGLDAHYPGAPAGALCERSMIGGVGTKCDRPVCSRPEGNTAQGLCDMSGNSWEWVQDWFHDSFAGAPADGRAWEDPPGTTRVSRVGLWLRYAGDFPAAVRDDDEPSFYHGFLGFRVARPVHWTIGPWNFQSPFDRR